MKYPWNEWTDGAWHRVAVEDVPPNFRGQVWTYASRHDLEYEVDRASNGDLMFRLGSYIDRENQMMVGTRGETNPIFDDKPTEPEKPVWREATNEN